MISVLFVCVRNAGKSPMAAGMLQQLVDRSGVGDVEVRSAGIRAGGEPNALSVRALAEVGVDIADHRPQQVTDELLQSADRVIVLGGQAGVECFPGREVERWDTVQPSRFGLDGIERMRLIRDDLARRVAVLHADLTR
ncbi:MAG: low molecular weight phosphatase family protein [Propionibacteriales bacterium]|nr:low molecular weight phosphatase family protein [Propionibacteriales bacterium]